METAAAVVTFWPRLNQMNAQTSRTVSYCGCYWIVFRRSRHRDDPQEV